MKVDEAMAWSRRWVQAQSSATGIGPLLSDQCCINYHQAAGDPRCATGRDAVVLVFAKESARRQASALNVGKVMFDTDALRVVLVYEARSIDVLSINPEGQVMALDVFSENLWSQTPL